MFLTGGKSILSPKSANWMGSSDIAAPLFGSPSVDDFSFGLNFPSNTRIRIIKHIIMNCIPANSTRTVEKIAKARMGSSPASENERPRRPRRPLALSFTSVPRIPITAALCSSSSWASMNEVIEIRENVLVIIKMMITSSTIKNCATVGRDW